VTVRESVRAALGLLSARDRRLYWVSVALQMATGFLDLAGVLLLGLVGALAVTTIQSQPAPEVIQRLTDAFDLGGMSDQSLVAVLAGVAAGFLLAKSVLSSLITRRVFKFLANRQAMVSARLTKELLSRPMTFVQRRSTQETAFALIQGTGAATLLVLGQFAILVSEGTLLLIFALALLLIDPLVTAIAVGFFLLFAFILQRVMGRWASRIGAVGGQADIDSLGAIQEALTSYRELTVMHRRDLYVDRVRALRWTAAKVSADRQFLTQFPKYMFELALVVGGLLLAGFLFATQNSVAAVGTLALFLAAASRVMPSLLRLQGAAITIRDASGIAGPLLTLADQLEHPTDDPPESHDPEALSRIVAASRVDMPSDLTLRDVTFRYPGSQVDALHDVNLHIPSGSSAALVGRSGAGKSTVADLLLGVLEPDSGLVSVGSEPPRSVIERWPGGIGYVPQDVALVNGSVRNNVALGMPEAAVDEDRVWEVLGLAGLRETVSTLDGGIDALVGERAFKLSGGQRQRLGLARALYARPKILVLDEATSALDAETESALTYMINELHGSVTVVLIAHRLSTVRNADQVIYLDNGSVVGTGTFDELRVLIPDLDRQATIMGLT
jgi:ABC-type multidrug transport system fused ATPase/permease subunit